jgi:hypothetical protein
MWRYSGLGRRISNNDEEAEQKLGLSESQMQVVQTLLRKADDAGHGESDL